MNLRIGKKLTESQGWFESIDSVDALYQRDLNPDNDGEFSLKVRDFLTAHDECDPDLYRDLTADHLLHSLDAYSAMWSGDDVVLSENDRYKGVGIFGAPGDGKSTAMLGMGEQDLMMALTALVLIDPSGQLSREYYSLAVGYKRDVTYISKENPCIGLNLMMAPYSKEQIAELVIAFINHLTATTSSDLGATTRMRNKVYEGVITCIDKGRPRLDALLDYLKLVRDPKNQFAIDGVIARLESILSVPELHKILCSEETVDWEDYTKNKKVLIVDTFGFSNLPAIALGSALTFLIREYFLAVRRPEMHPLALYIDEAHLFVSDNTMNDLLKMSRKMKVATCIATQDFSTIPQIFKQVMLSNLGTFICLNPGMREARELAGEFKDMDAHQVKFTEEKFQAAVKTPTFEGIVKMPPPPFTWDMPLPVYEVATNPMWFTEEDVCQ